MRAKYRGYRYKVRIRGNNVLEYVVYHKGLWGWLRVLTYTGPDFTRAKDEIGEAFVVRVHKKAQEWIDERVNAEEVNTDLRKAVNARNLSFVSKLMGEDEP